MAGLLDEILKNDALFAFGDTDTFAELIVYTFANAVPVVSSSIPATVIRQLPAGIEEAQGASAVSIEITVARADVPLPDTGGDYVTLAWRIGATPSRFDVQEIISTDTGMHQLRCRGKGSV